jgi:predicted nucleic acid-binding protein
MILYLDTSALLKKYFKESGSSEVISEWKKADAIATSMVAYAETMAAVFRKRGETQISSSLFKKMLRDFRKDWESFFLVEVTSALNEKIDKLVETHVLRGFDAVHLASALTIHQTNPEDFIFACYDQKLLQAAQSHGLQTLPKKII